MPVKGGEPGTGRRDLATWKFLKEDERGVVRWRTSRRRLPLKAHLSQIESIDKHIDRANRVAIVNEIISGHLPRRKAVAWEKRCGTRAELLLAFWASIGFKPGDFMTIGMNEKRSAWIRRLFDRVAHAV